jgi:tRNA A22 N-methylase
MPKIIKPSRKKIQVTKVIIKPQENTFKPLRRYFKNNLASLASEEIFFVLEKLMLIDTPTKKINIVAVARAKYIQKPE